MTNDILINNVYYKKKYLKYKKKYLNLKLNVINGGGVLTPVKPQNPTDKLVAFTDTVKKGSKEVLKKLKDTGTTAINTVIEGADNAIKSITGTNDSNNNVNNVNNNDDEDDDNDNNVDVSVLTVAPEEEKDDNKTIVSTIIDRADKVIKKISGNEDKLKDVPVSLVASDTEIF